MLRILIALVVLFQTPVPTEIPSVCVAPIMRDPYTDPISATPELSCESMNFSLRIDDAPPMKWSETASVKLEELDPAKRHRVVVLCGGKPHQSFSFRPSEYKTSALCLFLNDFYKTVQLWEAKKAPWCKCK